MPVPLVPLIGAGIGAIGGILGNIFGGRATKNANQQNIDFQREMYERQRKDALHDWDLQNQYNSPENQMRRLKEAGLNPNLVYGSGAVANNTQSVRSSSPTSGNIAPVRVDTSFIGESVNNYFNVQRQEKEIQLLQSKINNVDADTTNKISYDNELINKYKGASAWEDILNKRLQRNQMENYFEPVLEAKKQIANNLRLSGLKTQAETQTIDQSRAVDLQYKLVSIAMKKQDIAQSKKEIERIDSTIDYIKSQKFGKMLENMYSIGGTEKNNAWGPASKKIIEAGNVTTLNRVGRELFGDKWDKLTPQQQIQLIQNY